jgi:hypothetical protein
MRGGKARGDMRFHIDSHRATRDMQFAFAGFIDDRLVNARYVDDGRATDGCSQTLRPSPIGEEALTALRDDRTGDKRRSWGEARCQAAGDSKADDRGNFFSDRAF